MLNIEKYKNELNKWESVDLDCQIAMIKEKTKEKRDDYCDSTPCIVCRKENIEWLLSEAQILDNAEKRYLKSVIRPFRDKVQCILKRSNSGEWIAIKIINDTTINFPYFEKGSMYKGMKLNRKYTLEELGL